MYSFVLVQLTWKNILCYLRNKGISQKIDLLFCFVPGHNYIGSEHLLLGLLREGEGVAARVLENLGADPGNIRTQVSFLLKLSYITIPKVKLAK